MTEDSAASGREPREVLARAAAALRIFPLPGVVVLPGTATPFHIFEPRYRAMTAAALAGDRTLCVATLRHAGQAMAARAEVHPIAGAGFIEGEERLPDGRYHLAFRCTARVRLHEDVGPGAAAVVPDDRVLAAVPDNQGPAGSGSAGSVPDDRQYRLLRAELLEDVYPPGGPAAVADEVEGLLQLVYDLAKVLPEESGAPNLASTAARLRDPSRLADLVAAAVIQEPDLRLRVLEALDVRHRLSIVQGEVASVLLVLSRGWAPRA